MSSSPTGEKPFTSDGKNLEGQHVEQSASSALAAAIQAEDAEHAMTVWQAAKAYPMACFWAFIMAFCIVRTFDPRQSSSNQGGEIR